jgi:hypothetical protein
MKSLNNKLSALIDQRIRLTSPERIMTLEMWNKVSRRVYDPVSVLGNIKNEILYASIIN